MPPFFYFYNMIKYNTVKIDGNNLILDFEVEDKTYYSGVSIQGFRVDIPITYNTDTPYYKENEEDVTHLTKEIPIPDAKKELLIITPLVHMELPEDMPCGADVVDKTAVYDKNILLSKGLGYLKILGDTCNIPREFIDFILKEKALDMAIVTCNYADAIKYWKYLNMSKTITTKGCGCYG